MRLAATLALLALSSLRAEVTISDLDDRFRIEVNGKLFAEWQHKAWFAPYLYPVIGPDGECIVRHFPMKDGVEGEQQDHPHHRAIKFSHRDVNGYSFWAPTGQSGPRNAEIRLVEVVKMTGGVTGELILLNDWLGDEKLVLTEQMRLAFTPLENGQMLMDYDVELTAAAEDVTFGDNKDGGLAVRVASTMVVQNRHTKTGDGTIVNSNGEQNGEAWGQTRQVVRLCWPEPKWDDSWDRHFRPSREFALPDPFSRSNLRPQHREPIRNRPLRAFKRRKNRRRSLHDQIRRNAEAEAPILLSPRRCGIGKSGRALG